MSSTPKADYLDLIKKRVNPGEYRELHWEGGLKDYLELIQDHPLAVRNAYQRMYDMVLSYGSEPRPEVGEDVAHYRFFDDPMD
jgi:serine protein kinase